MEEHNTILPIVSTEEVTKIRKDLVEESIYNDIKYNIRSKSRWKFIGDLTETIAHLFMLAGSVLAFATGSFNIINLSFASGSCGILSLSLLRFSSYAMKESSERTVQVNMLLEKIGISKLPDITINPTTRNSLRPD
jgi:hypothetical protein